MKKVKHEQVTLLRLVNGGQALGELASGKKIFVWGGLPDEDVTVRITKSKSSYAEGVVTEVHTVSPDRTEPKDAESFLSTSPWQIMSFDLEQQSKTQLIKEAFEQHKVELPATEDVFTDGQQFGYRNKVEFSWWWDNDTNQLDLAFFRRGGKGKVPVNGTSLNRPELNDLALQIRDLLRTKKVEARSLKTVLIRCNQQGDCVWQLYVKDRLRDLITAEEAEGLPAAGGEIIYSDPRSPASRITERLARFGAVQLQDNILGKTFSYAAESFFQVNIPVYEQSLKDMQKWILTAKTVDMYSGVGSIGLTIGGSNPTLVEIDEHAHREMLNNIKSQKSEAKAVLAPSEKALEYIDPEACIIVDPPRAGLHQAVVDKLLEAKPKRIIYLSCNPVTQARDVALLQTSYNITHCQGYNYFPRTPHIENLVVLELRS